MDPNLSALLQTPPALQFGFRVNLESSVFKRLICFAALLAAGLTSILSQAAEAQQPEDRRSVVGSTLETSPQEPLVALELIGRQIDLDGSVDEEAWGEAIPVTDLRQQEPVEGQPASEETEIRVAFDEDDLYIAVIAYDDPTGIIARQKDRDASLFSDDRFQVILDTFLDGRTGYRFEINPAGAMVDGLLSGRGSSSGRGGSGRPGGFGGSGNAWDGIWEARTQRRPDGWSAEIRIPFRTLNFNPDLTEWGINFQRTIRRKNEDVLWRGWRRSEGMSPVFAGRLQGLRGMSQGLGLEAVPSTIASIRHSPCNDASGCVPGYDATTFPRDLSLDLNYSVTSSLRASASINTDFAEVEADRRQVNLTRFPLFFPERRDFFLEGSGVFSFAPSQGANPFYSRNIGLDEQSGQQIPIQYGTRLTGQADAYELGFYQIGTGAHTYFDNRTGVDKNIDSEDFTVARAKRNLFEQSSVGAIYTRRSRVANTNGETYPAHTAGVDLDLRTRNFLGNKNLSLSTFALFNTDPQRGGNFFKSLSRLSARGLRLVYPNDIWYAHISYREFGDDYDPAVGFVRRNNFRRVEPNISWSPRASAISWIRNFNFSAQWRRQWQMAGQMAGNLEEEELRLNLFGINLESGDGIDFSATRTHEFLDRDFRVSSDVSVTPGDYEWWEYRVFARTASYRQVGLFGSVAKGGFWNGDRTRIFGGFNLRPASGINSRVNLERNNVVMPTGDFTANVYSIETQWTPTPWVGFTNQVQYDDVSEIVGLFLRMRWIVNPGNDVYLVYTHNWQNYGSGLFEDPDLRTLSTGSSVKLNYTYRF